MKSLFVFVLLIAACARVKESTAPLRLPDGDILPPTVVPKLVAIHESDFVAYDARKAELGKRLFFDENLSGDRNISCATCHHPSYAMTDGLSLPIGAGGIGLGPAREPGNARVRIARNAPTLFNRGLKHFRELFWDGRVAATTTDLALALQARQPLLDHDEMLGGATEEAIVARMGMSLDTIAEAIAAYEVSLRAYHSPLQKFLEGDDGALTPASKRGMEVFRGKGNCLQCHHGPALSDGLYHATGVPQIGPGRGGVGFSARDDFGRELVTGMRFDRYRFKTPSLLNVALTGPWGHDGSVASLKAMVKHYNDPIAFLDGFDRRQVKLPFRADLAAFDFLVQDDPMSRAALIHETGVAPRGLSDGEQNDLVAFLESMSDSALVLQRKRAGGSHVEIENCIVRLDSRRSNRCERSIRGTATHEVRERGIRTSGVPHRDSL